MKTSSIHTKITLLLISSLTVMSGATIAPALPSMQVHFADITNSGFWIRLVLTIPALFIVISSPLTGYIIDRSKRLRLLIPALLLYGIAGSSGLYLDSLGAILIGRALLGVAVAGAMITVTTLIADYYNGSERSNFMGIQAAFMGLGGFIFLTGGGALAELGWRWPFAIYLFSILLIPLVLLNLSEPTRDRTPLQAGTSPVHTSENPFKLLWFLYFFGFFGMTLFYFVPLQIPFHLETVAGAGPATSGLAIAIATLFGTVTSLTYGRIYAVSGYVTILGLNLGLMGLGYVVIGLANSFLPILAGLILCGLGMGLMFPNLNVWLSTGVSSSIRGRAVGGLTTAIFLGQFMSPMASQPFAAAFGLSAMFWVAGVLLLLLAILFMLFRRRIYLFTTSSSASSLNDKEEVNPPVSSK